MQLIHTYILQFILSKTMKKWGIYSLTKFWDIIDAIAEQARAQLPSLEINQIGRTHENQTLAGGATWSFLNGFQ